MPIVEGFFQASIPDLNAHCPVVRDNTSIFKVILDLDRYESQHAARLAKELTEKEIGKGSLKDELFILSKGICISLAYYEHNEVTEDEKL